MPVPLCSICWEPMRTDLAAPSCGHVYHAGCLKTWMTKEESCPECRTECDEDSIMMLFYTAEADPPVDTTTLIADLLSATSASLQEVQETARVRAAQSDAHLAQCDAQKRQLAAELAQERERAARGPDEWFKYSQSRPAAAPCSLVPQQQLTDWVPYKQT